MSLDARVARAEWDRARAFVSSMLPDGPFRRIVLKPNWVKHSENLAFPAAALVTDHRLIAATIDACLERYPQVESIRVGDVPLQSCDWNLLCQQAGIDALKERYRSDTRIAFLDLRRERWRLQGGFMQLDNATEGDPLGYAEVIVDGNSQLEEVSSNADNFRVSDYDPQETRSKHSPGSHRYLIARTVLDAELLVNLPKMKTHQKSGITGALKNLVGINGAKAYLVHHQKGRPSQGGDEFPEDVSRVIQLQTAVREALQKRSRLAFNTLKLPWEAYKRLTGLATEGTPAALTGRMYVGPGSWYGNDSIWRMVYDLNLLLRFASRHGGVLQGIPQREVVSIVDGILSGEGNGPLQPIPVESRVLIGARNPFVADMVMAKLMGYDWRKIPLLAHHARHRDREFADIDAAALRIGVDGGAYSSLDRLPPIKTYTPPPGWRGRIELSP